MTTPKQWHFHNRSGQQRTEPLSLYWEVSGDPISDDYLPDEISAPDLMRKWVQRYGHQSETVDIYWSVHPVYEAAPCVEYKPRSERVRCG